LYEYSFWLKLMTDGYYNYVTDWILWHPTQTGIWMPDNVKRVLSRGATVGVHLQSKKDMNDRGFIASGNISYSYTKTTSLDAVSTNDNSQGKQLIYVPLHNFTATFTLQYRRFYIRCIHSHTGERYTTTDNSQSLKAYYLTHLEAGKDFFFSGQQIGLSFRVNNLANMQYQAVADRPMTGRSFEGTVRINLAK
jgi:vitamin B12 transporter